MIIVRMSHVRKAHLCSRGACAWFKQRNMNYTHFLQNGMAIEMLEDTGDAFAMAVCRVARDEYNQAKESTDVG